MSNEAEGCDGALLETKQRDMMRRLAKHPYAVLGWKLEDEMAASSLIQKPTAWIVSRPFEAMKRDSVARIIATDLLTRTRYRVRVRSSLPATLKRTRDAVVAYLDWVGQPYTLSPDNVSVGTNVLDLGIVAIGKTLRDETPGDAATREDPFHAGLIVHTSGASAPTLDAKQS